MIDINRVISGAVQVLSLFKARFEPMVAKYNEFGGIAKVAICGIGTVSVFFILYYPPTLTGIPLFGLLLTFVAYAAFKVSVNVNIFPKYGPLVSFFIYNQEFVVLNEIRIVRTLLNNKLLVYHPSFIHEIWDKFESAMTFGGEDPDSKYSYEKRRQIMHHKRYFEYCGLLLLNCHLYQKLDNHYHSIATLSKNNNNSKNVVTSEWHCEQELRHIASMALACSMFDPNLCDKKYLYNNNNNDNNKNKEISSLTSTPLHSDYVENNEAQSKFNKSI